MKRALGSEINDSLKLSLCTESLSESKPAIVMSRKCLKQGKEIGHSEKTKNKIKTKLIVSNVNFPVAI